MPNIDVFDGLLLPHEAVLWSGVPGQGILFAPRDGLLIPFSLVWGGFALFWETTVLRSGAPAMFVLFGAAFVVIAVFIVFGRFPFDAWLRSRTAYALTDRRVLILRSGPWSSFKAISLDRLPEATLSESPGGRGTIRFGQPAPLFGRYGAGFGMWIAALDPTPQFLAIPDAGRVFALVQERTNRNSR